MKSDLESSLPVGWRAGKSSFGLYLNLHYSWQCLSCELAAPNYFAATAPYRSSQQPKIAAQSEETSAQGAISSPFVLLRKYKGTPNCPFLTIEHSYFLFFLSELDICWHQVCAAQEYGWDCFMWTLWALCSAAALVVKTESSFIATHPVSGCPKSILDAELRARQAIELGYTCNKSKLIHLH